MPAPPHRTGKARAEQVATHPRASSTRRFTDRARAWSRIWDAAVALAPEEASDEFTRVPPTTWMAVIEKYWVRVKEPPAALSARRFANPAIAAAWDLAASAEVYVSYGNAGGREEVMIEFRELLDSLIGSSAEEYVEWIDRDLIDLRKLVPRFESYRDGWTGGNAPGYAYRLVEAARDIGGNLLMLQAADRWPDGDM